MAISQGFFGRRDSASALDQAVSAPTSGTAGNSASVLRSAGAPGLAGRGASGGNISTSAAQPMAGSPSERAANSDFGVAAKAAAEGSTEHGKAIRSTLTVGPNIKLKGVEITDCDTLVVEGRVEATMDSRLMQIAGCGAFVGTAEIDVAEIQGEFDGTLTVRETLRILASGKVSGTVKYGRLVIEDGGRLDGQVSQLTQGVQASSRKAANASA